MLHVLCDQLRHSERHVGDRLYPVRAVYTLQTVQRVDAQPARDAHPARTLLARPQVNWRGAVWRSFYNALFFRFIDGA